MYTKRLIILFALITGITTGCRFSTPSTGNEELVQVQVKGITIDVQSGSPVVLLEDSKDRRIMPIWIGMSEARAIATELEGITLPRPMTHDLMKSIISGLNAHLEKVVVNGLKNSTFFAVIVIRLKRKNYNFDSRPSDAIALALRFGAPIYVVKDVFENAQTIPYTSELPEGWQDVIMGFTAQDITREISDALDLGDVKGVLVADVRPGSTSERDGLKRGDIITGVNNRPISSLKDLVEEITLSEDKPMMVKILREGKEITLTLHPGEGE